MKIVCNSEEEVIEMAEFLTKIKKDYGLPKFRNVSYITLKGEYALYDFFLLNNLKRVDTVCIHGPYSLDQLVAFPISDEDQLNAISYIAQILPMDNGVKLCHAITYILGIFTHEQKKFLENSLKDVDLHKIIKLVDKVLPDELYIKLSVLAEILQDIKDEGDITEKNRKE